MSFKRKGFAGNAGFVGQLVAVGNIRIGSGLITVDKVIFGIYAVNEKLILMAFYIVVIILCEIILSGIKACIVSQTQLEGIHL